MPTLFERIIDGDLPGDFVYQGDDIVAFRDINPVAPVHVLIVPKKPIATTNDLAPDDAELVGRMFLVAKQVAAAEGVAEDGYRLLFNCGDDAGMVVPHLHLHLIGGRPLGGMVAPVK